MSDPDAHDRLTERNALSVSTSAVENLTLVSPQPGEIASLSLATSPRTRETDVTVGHGALGNEDDLSLRSSQTQVELVQREDDRRQGNTESNDQGQSRIVDNSSTRRNTERVATETVNGNVNRNPGVNNIGTTDGGNSVRHQVINALNTTRHAERRMNNLSQNHDISTSSLGRNTDQYTERRPAQGHAHARIDASNSRRYSDRHTDRRPSGHTQTDMSSDRSRAHRHSIGSRSVSSGRTRARSARTISTEEEEKDERYVVPALPMPVAIVCCVLNFIVPGLGSMTASVCVLCCAKTADMTIKEKCGSCCTVFGIGVLQLLLVACFLIGWIWSCIWGVTFIGMSANYYHTDDDEDADDLPAWERNLVGRTPLPAPQIVDNQPYPGIGYEDLRREYERRRRHRQEHQRRARSRISLTTSNLIYPMRAPSNIGYSSPPPPYEESATDQPSYRSLDAIAAGREETRRHVEAGHSDRARAANDFRPMNSIIQEETT